TPRQGRSRLLRSNQSSSALRTAGAFGTPVASGPGSSRRRALELVDIGAATLPGLLGRDAGLRRRRRHGAGRVLAADAAGAGPVLALVVARAAHRVGPLAAGAGVRALEVGAVGRIADHVLALGHLENLA